MNSGNEMKREKTSTPTTESLRSSVQLLTGTSLLNEVDFSSLPILILGRE